LEVAFIAVLQMFIVKANVRIISLKCDLS